MRGRTSAEIDLSEWSEKCVARARELQMGVIAMKVMGLNILGRGGTSVVPDDVTQNVAVVRNDLALREEDRMLLADYAVRAHQSDYVKSMAVV